MKQLNYETRADERLLARWANDRDESAFAELARQHVAMVHRAAMRGTGWDAHLADDVTQAVFLVLARRAGTLRPGTSLGAWLHQTTRYATLSARREMKRRRF